MPGVLLMRRFKPNLYLGGMIGCWGLVTIFTVFVSGYGSLCAIRLLIGFFEGSFYSCMSVYIGNCYDSGEITTRYGYLIGAAAISSAFGGLIATGITEIRTGPLENWRYLFLIEGLLTVLAAICVMIFLPSEASKVFKMNEEEKAVFEIRERRRSLFMGEEIFSFKWVRDAFEEPKTYLSFSTQFCLDICQYGFTTFLPSILNSMGYDRLQSQYLTIPVYILGFLSLITFPRLSDKYNSRSPFLLGLVSVATVGFIIVLACDNNKVQYFGCYLIALSFLTSVGLNEGWMASNSAPIDKRATSIALNQAIGNAAGIVAPQVYRQKPYVLGLSFTIGIMGACIVLIIMQSLLYRYYNKRNSKRVDLVQDKEAEKLLGDRSAYFKFVT